MTSDQIVLIVNIGLIVIFALVLIGLFIAAIRGIKKGIFKSVYKFLFFFVLFAALLICLNPLSEVIGNINLSFLPFKSIKITVTETGEVWYAPVTTLFGTIRDSFEVAYQAFNPGAPSAKAAEFGVAIATSLTKYITLFLGTLVFLTIGTLIGILLWNICFKHVVPKLARRLVRIRWASLLTNVVTYIVCAFLFVAPLSAMVNTVGNASKTATVNAENNETVQLVNDIVDTYNNSLIANVFFNWTADESGLTIDQRYVGTATETVIGDATINLIYELNNVADLASYALEGITFGENGVVIDYSFAFTTESVEQIFKCLENSELFMYALPIAAELAVNSGILDDYIDLSNLSLTDIEWKTELDNLEEILKDVINSGLVDEFITEDNQLAAPSDISTILEAILEDDAREYYEDIFKSIDDSLLLSRVVPVVVDFVCDTLGEDPNTASYVEDITWDDISSISWGEELNIVYSSLCQLYDTDDRIIDVIADMSNGTDSGDEPALTATYSHVLKEGEGETTEEFTLIDLVTENLSAYSDILFGKYTNSTLDTSILDDDGKTIVYDANGNKISGREYCLFDSELIQYLGKPLLTLIQDAINSTSEDPSSETITDEMITTALDELNDEDEWRFNYKTEFNAISDTFGELLDNEEIKAAIENNFDLSSLIPEGDITAISDSVVESLQSALPNVDNSIICNCLLVPTLHDLILSDDTKSMLNSFGLDADVVEEGYANAAENKCVGHELADLLGCLKDIKVVKTALEKPTTEEIVEDLSTHSLNVARLLDSLYESDLLNYNGSKGENYNYFNLIENTMNGNLPNGITFKEDVKNDTTITWNDTWNSDRTEIISYGENGYFADVLRVIGEKDFIQIANALSTESDVVSYLATEETNNAPIQTLLKSIDNSMIFSATIGDFLDDSLSSSGLLESGVSFNNVDDWSSEGDALHYALVSIGKLSIDLNNLDLAEVTDVVALNDLLHALANSGIFNSYDTSTQTSKYLLGTWLFDKVGSSLQIGDNDLLADPVDPNQSLHPDTTNYWKAAWGENTSDNYTISRNDFESLSKDDWASESYVYEAFDTSSYGSHYWDNAQFESDYFGDENNTKYRNDELGKLTYVIYNLSCKVGNLDNIMDTSSVSIESLESLLYAINDTNILRMSIYNLFVYIQETLSSNAEVREFINLDSAYLPYLIDGDTDSLTISEESRLARKDELASVVTLFSALDEFQKTEGLLDGGINMDKMTSSLVDKLKDALHSTNESNVFHRKGSILTTADGVSEDWNPTVFQNTVNAILGTDDFAELMVNKNNPKDVYYGNVLGNYTFDNSTNINDVANQKVKWVINEQFSSSSDADFDSELEKCDQFTEVLLALIGAPTTADSSISYKGLHDNNDKVTFNIANVDFTKQDNVEGLESVLNVLLDCDLLYDAVPNAVDLAIENSFSGISGTTYLDISDANIFYHYFKTGNTYSVPNNVNNVPEANWSNRFSSEDVTTLTNIMATISSNPDLPSMLSDISSITPTQKGIVNSFIDDIQSSTIFHRSGSKYIANADGSLSLAKSHGLTVFQELTCEIYAGSMISSYFYDASNETSKDYKANQLGLYSNVNEKAIRYAKTFFSSTGTLPSDITVNDAFDKVALSYDEQVTEISNLLCLIDYSSIFDDIKSSGIDSLDASNIEALLKDINNTNSLYDIVPNVLNKTFNSDLSVSGINLSDGEYYYQYTFNKQDANYTVKYDEDEISNICNILSDYQTLQTTYNFNNIDISDIASLNDNLLDFLSNNLLPDVHASKVMHQASRYLSDSIEYATSDTKLTVFEQFMYKIIYDSGLSDYSFDATYDSLYTSASLKTKTRLKNLSAYEAHSSLEGFDGFKKYYDNGEITYLFDLIKTLKADMNEAGISSFNDLSLSSLSPTASENLMRNLNNIYTTHGALASFVKEGFSSIGLTDYITYTYDSIKTDESIYNFSQSVYKDTEIGYLVDLLDAIQTKDANDQFTGYESFDNISSATILSYVKQSQIFSKEFTTGGNSYTVSGRGLFMYNVLGNETLLKYVTGSNNDTKLKVLDTIITADYFNAENEGNALDGIKSHMSALSSVDFNDYEQVIDNVDEINAAFTYAYDAKNDDSDVRSYLVSEIMSNVLNESLADQYEELDTAGTYYEECDLGIDSYLDINENAYDNLNEIENNGLKGVTQLSDILSNYNTLTNKLDGVTEAQIKQAYAYMGEANDTNSSLARIYYLNKIHSVISGLTQTSHNIWVSESWSDLPTDVYNASFCFKDNGVSLANYFISQGMIS